MVRAFVQARMSSKRFPGKVLAPLRGEPVIAHVLSRVSQVLPMDRITVATSDDTSDDPLVHYLHARKVQVFRGSLTNVFARFQACLKEYPCDWFLRVCADSPLIDPKLLSVALNHQNRTDLDLVTNVQTRTFPKGQSVEMVRLSTFARIDEHRLSAEEKEHLTKVYYDHPSEFRILNFSARNGCHGRESFAVDTVSDIERLEKLFSANKTPVTPAFEVGEQTA